MQEMTLQILLWFETLDSDLLIHFVCLAYCWEESITFASDNGLLDIALWLGMKAFLYQQGELHMFDLSIEYCPLGILNNYIFCEYPALIDLWKGK
jgi:hypothetical protein